MAFTVRMILAKLVWDSRKKYRKIHVTDEINWHFPTDMKRNKKLVCPSLCKLLKTDGNHRKDKIS